jgi:hypothetical protein
MELGFFDRVSYKAEDEVDESIDCSVTLLLTKT